MRLMHMTLQNAKCCLGRLNGCASWEASPFKWNKSAHKSDNKNKETQEESNLIASKSQKKSHDKAKSHKRKNRAFDIDAEFTKAAIKQESFMTESTSSSSEEEWLNTLPDIRVGKARKSNSNIYYQY